MDFAANLRRLRELHGFDRKMMADYIDVSVVAYGHYENGLREPTLPNLIKLAEKLNVSTDELLGVKKSALVTPEYKKYDCDGSEEIEQALAAAGYQIREYNDFEADSFHGPVVRLYKNGLPFPPGYPFDDWNRMFLIIKRIIDEATESASKTIIKRINLLYDHELYNKTDDPDKWTIANYLIDYAFLFTSPGALFHDKINDIVTGRMQNPFNSSIRTKYAKQWANFKFGIFDIDLTKNPADHD